MTADSEFQRGHRGETDFYRLPTAEFEAADRAWESKMWLFQLNHYALVTS